MLLRTSNGTLPRGEESEAKYYATDELLFNNRCQVVESKSGARVRGPDRQADGRTETLLIASKKRLACLIIMHVQDEARVHLPFGRI